jgi:hypothetical protein
VITQAEQANAAPSCPAVGGETQPPADDDSGDHPVGGVSTGGGGLATSAMPVSTNPAAMLVLGGLAVATGGLRRRKR